MKMIARYPVMLMTAATAKDYVFVLLVLSIFVVLVGVLLPAVWSAKPSRRRDARAVLEVVLQWSLDLLAPGGRRGRR
ncbi:hypothetical protein [Actinomadura violacea]|uniref:Uncharacterized protein n=1 Tax=Actinomadura violacea TaxID=2819934 RepID=A0ABS3RXZ6_9ACTN|nr:hypothetical protein [Actinomadura violacea]MBO2461168.1 hypothetical protein [Actinomadura violacea]